MATKISWIIGILLVAGFLIVMGIKLFSPRPEAPTPATTKRGVLEIIKPEMPISEVLGSQPSGKENAGEYYNEGVRYFKANEKDFKEIYTTMTSGTSDNPKLFGWQQDLCLNLMKKIAPAAECESMKYVFVFTPEEIKVSGKPDGQDELFWIKNMLEMLCVNYQQDNNWKEAIAPAKAMLLLGWHMTQDDSRAMLQITGLEMQAEAAQRLALYYNKLDDKKMAQTCETYYNQIIGARTLAQEKYGNIWNLRQRPGGKQGPFPGDLFNVIKNDKSRAWRVDAILALGITKLQEIHNKGNNAEIERIFAEYSQSNDPLIRAAAKSAKAATKSDIEENLRGE